MSYSLGSYAKFKCSIDLYSIQEYIENGGSLMVLLGENGEAEFNTNVNFLLEDYGMSINNGFYNIFLHSLIWMTLIAILFKSKCYLNRRFNCSSSLLQILSSKRKRSRRWNSLFVNVPLNSWAKHHNHSVWFQRWKVKNSICLPIRSNVERPFTIRHTNDNWFGCISLQSANCRLLL